MKSLNRYMSLQQQKFERMQQRREQLQQSRQLEQSRFEQLHAHRDEMLVGNGGSALYLQNMADIREQLRDLCEQQQQRVADATQECSQQQRACLTQASFNLGLQRMLDRHAEQERQQQATREQKQLDELVCSYHGRQV